MPELRAPALKPEWGCRLDREAYRRDFRERDARIRGRDSWKLERLQYFEEQNSPSRDALRRGDWEGALRLLEERRGTLEAIGREDEERGSHFHRVRVVERPLTGYLQWELHSLRMRAECGERVRIVPAEDLADGLDPLPEVVVLGGRTLYHVQYTPTGVPDGAVRHVDPELVGAWEEFIGSLYRLGEDVASWFAREVAPLAPPGAETE
ncbi:DUF6879 family protein [Kitasatospora cheerisanensis]|uniref:DUF6879 domain-containing protein n=1 Tax=Kitasatospora cheerisanensis KCTC 2395 TaxID=1348663 RepID=A0A066YYJ0_9ACTN|nr:DUF6879 family protein [Kitasatospora cheerisanensis]KDN86603.1 hypothetical protein KCH_16990 [Kitasatospora cheerisanensis KCTC 2395]